MPAYVDAVCREMVLTSQAAGDKPLPVHTIFWGGGTPSLLSPAQVEQIMSTIRTNFQLCETNEATLEANPGTVSPGKLAALRQAGFNRISFGMQSAAAEELKLLRRLHTQEEVGQAVKWARQAGFNNLNLDLIYGLPGQSLKSWQLTLEAALMLQPEHLSMYSLTIEEGTPLYEWVEAGQVPQPDEDLTADMYEWAMDAMRQAGFIHYEISNWAANEDLMCRHNLQYWHNQPYFGFGAGAHGYINGVRTANLGGVAEYIDKIWHAPALDYPASPSAEMRLAISKTEQIKETMMVGLRLVQEGIHAEVFKKRFGVELENVFGKEIQTLVSQGLLEWQNDNGRRLHLTRRGCLLGNQVFMQFVGD